MQEELATIQKVYDVLVEFIIQYSFQIVGALIILVIGVKLAGWLGRMVTRLCEKREIDLTLGRFFGNLTKIMVLVFVIIIAIGKFGISIAPFIAALGAVAFGSSFAIQGPLSNYGAGLSIILSRPFVVGNTIMVQGVSGVVDEIRLAATILTNEDGEKITIPNKHVVGEIIHNSFANKVAEVSIGISYGADPQLAINTIRQVLDGIDGVCQEPPPQVGIEAFGDSSVNLGMRYWIQTTRYFHVLYQANQDVYAALKKAGVTIPFPQREVRMLKEEG
jgi:small conductance mechanosensitive channel